MTPIRSAPLALVLALAAGGCALDLEMDVTAGPVFLGDTVTYGLNATNVTSCTLSGGEFTLVPLLTPADEALIDQALADEGLSITVAQLCGDANGAREGLRAQLTSERVSRLQALATGQPASSAGGVAAVPSVVCTPMVSMQGIATIECALAEMAPADTFTTEQGVTATTVGTLRNILFSLSNASGVCDGGMNAGQACQPNLQNSDCPGANCDPGVCAGGENDGLGCEDGTDCPEGQCIDCERCSTDGVCVDGEKIGESCHTDSDCDEGVLEGECSCGGFITCSFTTVVPVPQGGDCTDTAECTSGLFCADGVCCDSECTGPLESCDQAGTRGVCSPIVAPAPTLSPAAWALGLLALLASAGIAMRRRQAG